MSRGPHEAVHTGPPHWLRVALPAVILLATLVTFAPALNNGFVNWDDGGNLLNNPDYRGLGLKQLKWAFTTNRLGVYQPLSWVLFGLQYVLFDMRAAGYHLTSIVLHALSALVSYFVALRLLRLAGRRSRDHADTATLLGAGVAAMAFAVHPLRAETAVWASGQPFALCGLMYLLTVHTYLIAHSRTGRARSWWLVLAVVCCAAAMMSKGIAVSLPAVLLILDFYPLRRIGGARDGWLSRQVGRVLIEKLPFILLAVATAVVGVHATEVTAEMGYHRASERFALASYGLAFYLRKTLLPVGLSAWYPLPDDLDPADWQYVLSGAFFLAITAAVFALRRRCPALLAAWACYVVSLAPVLGLVTHSYMIAADRYSLLACMGVALLIGGASSQMIRRAASRDSATRSAWVVAALAAFIALASLSWRQARVWHDGVTLWEQMVAVMPDRFMAHMNLGCALADDEQLDRAIDQFKACLDIRPDDVDALGDRASALMRLGRIDEAGTLYVHAVRAHPDSARAHYNLGTFQLSRGQPDEAVASFRRAVALDPQFALAWNNLAGTLLMLGQPAAGISALRQALVVAPNDAKLQRNLAWVLATCGRAEFRDGPEAVRLAERVSAHGGHRDPIALDTLAAAYAEAGRFDDAVRTARHAIDLARAAGRTTLALRIADRLSLYESRRPYHAPELPPGVARPPTSRPSSTDESTPP